MSVNKLRKSSGINSRAVPIFIAVTLFLAVPIPALGKTAVEWDFSKGIHGWTGNGRVENLSYSPEGLLVKSTGEDPWIEGPVLDLPGDKIIRVKIRMKSNADAGAELFYGRVFRAGDSVRFTTRTDGQWHDYSLVIRDKLGPGTRFRLDPCIGAGQVTVARITVETISEIIVPSLEKPREPNRTSERQTSVKSGGLEFRHYGGTWGNFALKVNGVEMAAGYQSELLGLVFDEQPEWLNLKNAKMTFGNPSTSSAGFKDSGGGIWDIRRSVRAAQQQGTLIVEIELKADKDRDIIHIPWLTIFPGLGTFGQRKDQGLFAGLEYLCDESSSSEADIATPDHVRRVPDPVKITFPLIAIAQSGNYIGVIWEPSEAVAATFDSPDRIYHSGAHVIALSGPRVGDRRFENAFCAQAPLRLRANQPLKVTAMIIGGKGKSVIPAVRHYVDLKGLPAVPELEGDLDAAVDLLAQGWLDSQINENGLFRHAVWGDNFPAGPAADAAMYIDWLANHTENENLRERLSNEKSRALSRIPSGQPFSSSVSHAHLPTAPFIFGRTFEFVQQRRSQALRLLTGFDADGVKLYRPGETDYSKTHFAKHANGLAGRDMAGILEGATLSADRELINEALKLLDKQTALYADTVPRGAQTWEVPLHTPDILASAHMVKAYALGYMISGRQEYLDQARYWAWTGVPFVYLQAPTSGRVGVYSTIAVLGATNWKAPLWLGRPVQWCGLVYCSALHLLSEFDPNGPWEKIAKGITVTGLQMTWPQTDEQRQGLLPDFFDLRAQITAGPAINPGTVQAHLAELYGKGKIYDVKKLPRRGWFVHAPCKISDIREDEESVTLTADGWGGKQYYVLISGIEKEPSEVSVNPGKSHILRSAETQFHREQKILIIALEGKSVIQIKRGKEL
ncbi:MAG: hypothetical protein WBC05_03355 [Sedimentisphaerales bacterium]